MKMTTMIDKQHLPLAGQRRKAVSSPFLGCMTLINKDADFAEIDAGLLSVITDARWPDCGL